jgi:hypothetical protein
MRLQPCRFFLEHVRMLLQSLRALCKAAGGAGSIWKYLKVLVRATEVSGRLAYSFWTELHFADIMITSEGVQCWFALQMYQLNQR